MNNNIDPRIVTLALVRFAGINPRMLDLLLREFRSIENIVMAEQEQLEKIKGISQDSAYQISTIDKHLKSAEDYDKELKQRDITITTRYDSGYPETLFEINDPPPLIYSRGNLPQKDKKIVAVTGADKATQNGIALTTTLTKELVAKNVQVVSSITNGIDSAVHIGARSAGGNSFAVIDSGFDNITGDAEVPLVIDIVKNGGVITEYAPDARFDKNNYIESNRLMAGMTQAVVITEIYEHSQRSLDILKYCNQIGKLSFILIDPKNGALSDEPSLARAVEWGAIPMSGPDQIDHIIKALV